MIRRIAVFAFAALTLSACGNDTPQCTPGESAQCFCASGTGAQTCQSDGTFGACSCGSGNNTSNVTPNNTTPANGTSNNVTTPTNNMTTSPTNNMTSTNNVTTPTNSGGTRYCKQACNVGPDCAAFGDPSIWECNNSACDVKACTTDDRCVKQMSNWSPGCNTSAQCGIGFACVTVDGANYCAFEPIPAFFECGQLQLDDMLATSVDTGMPTTICAAPDALCEQSTGNCFRPCTADADCRPEGTTVGLICMPNGQCGCTENAHCTVSGDLCIDGECACSNQSVCDIITGMSGVEFNCVN